MGTQEARAKARAVRKKVGSKRKGFVTLAKRCIRGYLMTSAGQSQRIERTHNFGGRRSSPKNDGEEKILVHGHPG